MAIVATLYDQTPKLFLDQTVDFLTDTIKMALVDSSYTPSSAHTQWADVSANEEADASYASKTLASKVIDNSKIDADNPEWTALTATFRYAVLYANVTAGGLTDPLLCYYLLDDTPADIVIAGADYSIPFAASGIFTYS